MTSPGEECLGHAIATFTPFVVRSPVTSEVLIGFSFVDTSKTSIIVHLTPSSLSELLPSLLRALEQMNPLREQRQYQKLLGRRRKTPEDETLLHDHPITNFLRTQLPLPHNAMDVTSSTFISDTHLTPHRHAINFDFTFTNRHSERFTMPLWMTPRFGEDAYRALMAAQSDPN